MKNAIKLILGILPLIIFCSSCQKEILAPLQSCETLINHNNDSHSKATSLQSILDKRVAEGLPGAVMIVETPDDGKWVGVSGYAKLETKEKMTSCRIFHSASVAKTYHVVAAMSLVEAGKLDLDLSIDNYLPDWVCQDLANRNSATVRQLMNHTSGIPDFIEDSDHILEYFNDLLRQFTTAEYIDFVCGDKALFAPGEGVEYSNTNTVLLALIMDEIAGSHADVISENIIQKLGLEHTFYKNEPNYPAPTGAVNTYVDIKGNGVFINSTEIERNFASMNIGHDAILASADDYFTFIKALMQGTLVSQNSLEQMMDYIPYAEKRGYGLGLEIVESTTRDITLAGHDGGSLGAANLVFHIPENNTTIVVCSNFGNFLDGPAGVIFYKLFQDVYDLLNE